MRLDEVMKRSLQTCRSGDSLDRVVHAMWEGNSGCVPVVDASGCLVGVVTDRDICMAAYFRGTPLCAIKVQDAMSKGVFACKPQDETTEAEILMRSHRLFEIPIVDAANRVVGVVSLNDLVFEMGDKDRATRPDLVVNEMNRPLGVEDFIAPV